MDGRRRREAGNAYPVAPANDEDDARVLRDLRSPGLGTAESRYVLLRATFLRGLGLVYLVAFLVSALQGPALVGEHGLLPAAQFLERVREATGSASAAFWKLPTVFWLGASDRALGLVAWCGVVGSAVLLLGLGNAPLLFFLWSLYLSLVHVGQVFYGYGWESLLCEVGFLAVFFTPALDPRPIPAKGKVPEPVVVLLRWLTFRVMFGAGLIKLRGDPCWTDLTCLAYHYETQPNPHPLSYLFHQLPMWAHRAGTLFNHAVELVAPFFVFGPRRARLIAGTAVIAFQVILILSGNLSFLNWLTIVVALSCFDDGVVHKLFPERWRERARKLETEDRPSRARRLATYGLCGLVGVLSINPIMNLLSSRQRMNSGFDPFQLVNTYGAFGSVSRTRDEVVLEGTNDPSGLSGYRAYELPCKPGDPARRPCWVTPYHHRLDWQMWFLQFAPNRPPAWLVHLVSKLLSGDPETLSLFAGNPFPDHPPRFVRATLYRYRFTKLSEPGWWHRERLGEMLPPLSENDPRLRRFLQSHGWDD